MKSKLNVPTRGDRLRLTIRPTRKSVQLALWGVLLCSLSLCSMGAVLPIESYSFASGAEPYTGNPAYSDWTPPGKLKNGYTGSVSTWWDGEFVLWQMKAPNITFNFAQASEVSSFSIFILNLSAAGICAPVSVTLTDTVSNASETFVINPDTFGAEDAHWATFQLTASFVTNQVVLSAPVHSGGAEWIGISEVRFETIPEPCSWVLLGTGVLFFVLCRPFRRHDSIAVAGEGA